MHYYNTVIYIDVDTTQHSDLAKLDRLLLEGYKFHKLTALATESDVNCFTHPKTLEWYNFDKKNAKNMKLIDSGIMVFPKNFLTSIVMKIWLACAFDPECIAPKALGHKSFLSRWFTCEARCECHKYDVSALSIINYVFLNVMF